MDFLQEAKELIEKQNKERKELINKAIAGAWDWSKYPEMESVWVYNDEPFIVYRHYSENDYYALKSLWDNQKHINFHHDEFRDLVRIL